MSGRGFLSSNLHVDRCRELFLMYFDVPEGWKSYLQGHLQPAWLAVSTDSLAPQVAGTDTSNGNEMYRRHTSQVESTQYQSTILLHQSLKFYSCFQFYLHPGRLTWNLQITHLERKMIFQTSMIMFHVNLQGCTPKSTNFFTPFASFRKKLRSLHQFKCFLQRRF